MPNLFYWGSAEAQSGVIGETPSTHQELCHSLLQRGDAEGLVKGGNIFPKFSGSLLAGEVLNIQ
jgi:hypothetical protein